MNKSRYFTAFVDIRVKNRHRILLRCLTRYSVVSDCTSMASLAPRRKAYSKMATSARLTYSSQQSWNFSKISFCLSVSIPSSSSRFRATSFSSSFSRLSSRVHCSKGELLPYLKILLLIPFYHKPKGNSRLYSLFKVA